MRLTKELRPQLVEREITMANWPQVECSATLLYHCKACKQIRSMTLKGYCHAEGLYDHNVGRKAKTMARQRVEEIADDTVKYHLKCTACVRAGR